MKTTLPLLCAAAMLCQPGRAQDPVFKMTPAVRVSPGGSLISWSLTGAIPAPYVLLADLTGGPVQAFGEDLLVGFSPVVVRFAPASSTGAFGTIQVPPLPRLPGMVLYAQPVLLTPQARNGFFRPLNGASTAFHSAPFAVVADFTDPITDGYQGTYNGDVFGHLRGGAVLRRTKDTWDPQASLLGWGIQSPLNPAGSREQMVFRRQDLGGNGEPELITAVRWMPFRGAGVLPDKFAQFELRMGHTAVTPDYSVDPISALARAPGSGLSATFKNNELLGEPTVRVASGPYTLDPANRVFGHFLGPFLPYPLTKSFAWDGVRSLLLDVRAAQGLAGVNGMQVQLMLQSGPLPAARAVAGGLPGLPLPLPNPGAATQANILDCAMPIMQFDFVRVETTARSPWHDSGRAAPNYSLPVLAVSLPSGTLVTVRFRGADTAVGGNATAWSDSQDVADGHRFLQFELHLFGDPISGAVPLVDTLAVPVF